jgi:hypothetical protein
LIDLRHRIGKRDGGDLVIVFINNVAGPVGSYHFSVNFVPVENLADGVHAADVILRGILVPTDRFPNSVALGTPGKSRGTFQIVIEPLQQGLQLVGLEIPQFFRIDKAIGGGKNALPTV